MPRKKLLKQLLLQSAQLDDLATASSTRAGVTAKDSSSSSKKRNLVLLQHNTDSIATKHTNKEDKSENENEVEVKIKSQLDSILFYDKAFSRRSDNTESSKKRKMDELQKASNHEAKVMNKTIGSIGNSRSSSSMNARRNRLPTFNKKRDKEKKRIQSLNDLAKQLRKRRKKKN